MGQIFRPLPSGGVFESAVATPTIANVVATLADTEYSYTLPAGTISCHVQGRGLGKLKLYFTTGATEYVTIWPGKEWERKSISPQATITLFFQNSKAGEVIEIETWA